MSHVWKQLDEVVLGVRVDPEPLRLLLPADMELDLDEGQARVAIMPQDCSQYWVDGEDHGPTRLLHVLVGLGGARETRPIVGAERTMPPMSWFALLTASSGALDREHRRRAGFPAAELEQLDIERPDAGTIGVAGATLGWQIETPSGQPSLVGVDHDVYVPDGDGRTRLKRVQAVGRAIGGPVRGRLEVSGRLGGETPFLPPGAYPARAFSFRPVWARVDLG